MFSGQCIPVRRGCGHTEGYFHAKWRIHHDLPIRGRRLGILGPAGMGFSAFCVCAEPSYVSCDTRHTCQKPTQVNKAVQDASSGHTAAQFSWIGIQLSVSEGLEISFLPHGLELTTLLTQSDRADSLPPCWSWNITFNTGSHTCQRDQLCMVC